VGGKQLLIQARCARIYVNLMDAWKINKPIAGIRGSRVVAAKKLASLYSMDSNELMFAPNRIDAYLEDKITKEIKDSRFDESLATNVEKDMVRVLSDSYVKAYVGELIEINEKFRNTKIAVGLTTILMSWKFWEMNIQFFGVPTVLSLIIFTVCLAEEHDELKNRWSYFIENLRKNHRLTACEIVKGWKIIVERDALVDVVGVLSSKKKVQAL
jgi:hypothetical protein